MQLSHLVVCLTALSGLPAGEGLGHRLLVAGWGLPHIAVHDAAGHEEWRVAGSGNTNDCWLIGADRIVYTFSNGVREVQRDATAARGCRTIWEYQVPKGCEVHGCQPLEDDQVILLCENRAQQIDLVEIERPSMRVKSRLRISDRAFSAHDGARQVRKTVQGHYLFTLMKGSQDGREYDASGKLIRTFPGLRFSLQQLRDGSYLGAGGDNRTVKGFDADGKETWTIGPMDIPGFHIGFAAAVQFMDDGTYLIVNWGGHGGSGGPCIGRISADRKTLIGSLAITPANRIVCFQLLPETVPPKQPK